jgi:hypothetical protein
LALRSNSSLSLHNLWHGQGRWGSVLPGSFVLGLRDAAPRWQHDRLMPVGSAAVAAPGDRKLTHTSHNQWLVARAHKRDFQVVISTGPERTAQCDLQTRRTKVGLKESVLRGASRRPAGSLRNYSLRGW